MVIFTPVFYRGHAAGSPAAALSIPDSVEKSNHFFHFRHLQRTAAGL
jgi:hypothetical protein